MEVRFQLAMLVSVWMKLNRHVDHLSLTSLQAKGRKHWEKWRVGSFFGKNSTSCFQAGRQGNLLLREEIHHLRGHHHLRVHRIHQETIVHPFLRGIAARLHLHLQRLRLRPLNQREESGRITLLRRGRPDAENDKIPSQEYRRLLPS